MTTLSLRRLWTIYKCTAIGEGLGASKRDLALSRVAFYSGARGVLRVCLTTCSSTAKRTPRCGPSDGSAGRSRRSRGGSRGREGTDPLDDFAQALADLKRIIAGRGEDLRSDRPELALLLAERLSKALN